MAARYPEADAIGRNGEAAIERIETITKYLFKKLDGCSRNGEAAIERIETINALIL